MAPNTGKVRQHSIGKIMRQFLLTIAFAFVGASALAAPMLEIKGLRPAEGCLHDSKAVTERVIACPIGGVRIRIWCPNGKVFDRDGPDLGVAVARSICEMNQLP
jgi:hypothetical protein